MSILVKELEARKDDYILVADVINVMANATNSAPDEVVKYLMGFDIDEHLTIFYMDEYYSFERYCDWLEQVGNDANITYFKKADVMAFEPITKHGIFKESQATNGMVHDVYGRTYDVNQHKKNREDDYLTLTETLSFLNCNDYDYVRLRDIARRKLITPCFYFDGYVGSFRGDSDDSDNGFYTEVIAGYFTYRSLAEEICSDDDYMRLPNDGVMIYSILEKKTAAYVDGDDVFLFYDKPQGLDEAEKFKLTHIEAGEIRFSKRALDSYIASIQSTSDNHFIEHVKLVEGDKAKQLESLKTKNDNLNARLNIARDTYKQNQNEIKELKIQLEKANADNTVLNEKLSTANAELAAAKNTTTAQPIDWQSVGKDEKIYPPELHLAMMIWQRIYLDNELKNNHLNYHTDKFKVIASRMNLDPNSTLGKRIAMIINTAYSKNQQASLADPLRAIEQLHMPPSQLEPTP